MVSNTRSSFIAQMIMQIPISSHGPTNITCPSCQATVTTTVSRKTGDKTHLAALGLCLIGFCCLCCLFPYLTDGLKDAIHSCPNCKAVVGNYKL